MARLLVGNAGARHWLAFGLVVETLAVAFSDPDVGDQPFGRMAAKVGCPAG